MLQRIIRLVTLACVLPAAALAEVLPAAERAPPSPSLTVELGAAWQLRNTAQVANEPPNTRFKIDELTGDGPYPAGRIVEVHSFPLDGRIVLFPADGDTRDEEPAEAAAPPAPNRNSSGSTQRRSR